MLPRMGNLEMRPGMSPLTSPDSGATWQWAKQRKTNEKAWNSDFPWATRWDIRETFERERAVFGVW